ncbi:hypothetical protein BDV59DRAFT_168445 [Aspergillus ambiguus]|uniref:putative endosome-associated ubiquitin isopeptidase (AmsH) n=1 Tax=Aspergillus ambiguus TaxID=176160 RepID=UPI003CCCED0F
MASHLATATATGASPPHSVKDITRIAQDYEYNPSIPLRYWLRTAATLVKEAYIYTREGNDEQAYLLLFRHAQLVLVNLAKHPDAKEEPYRKALTQAEQEVKKNLEILEALKPRINKRYERYLQLMRDRKARAPPRTPTQTPPPNQKQHNDPALSGKAEPLEAGANRDLAVKLARTEISRRATVKAAIRQSGISADEERQRRAAGVWGDWEDALQQDGQALDNDLSQRIQDVRFNMEPDRWQQRPTKPAVQPPAVVSSESAYKYPTVPRQRPFDVSPPPLPKDLGEKVNVQLEPPIRPPKEDNVVFDEVSPPPRPDKLSPAIGSSSTSVMAPPLPDKVQPTPESTSRPDLHPSNFTFKPSAYLENGTPLRTVFLPPELRTHFLKLAAPNTRRNLETCGILCGTLISNALFVSRLLIPEQTSTSDTCETVNESAIFDYCDSEDLMVLGWIHTHPSQTCFMSSRDLHTHCGYQVMMPESIAIVCAPSKTPDWGVFRLTDPPGLKSVLNCTQTGLFHPHAETNIYTDALRPGHVFEARGLEFETVDLRPSA